jgi:hypothetical protein
MGIFSSLLGKKDAEAKELLVKKVKEAGLLEAKNAIGLTPLGSGIQNNDKGVVLLLLKYSPKLELLRTNEGLFVDGARVFGRGMEEIFAKHEEEISKKEKIAKYKKYTLIHIDPKQMYTCKL